MSTTKKVFLRVIPVVLVLMVVASNAVFGFNNFSTSNMQNFGTESIGSADTAVKKIWGTVSLILQVLAVAAIVFAGVRYMFASADGKADIKKQTVGLVVGAVLVFGASMIVNFIVNVTSEITT
jgi:type IV secretory pathway VirB2 component (pilin)